MAPSAIHGLGVFAEEFIPKGTVIWRFDERFDIRFSKDELEALPSEPRSLVLHHGYIDTDGTHILSLDHDRYVNHSRKPNVDASDRLVAFALRDIVPGEEITEDYGCYGNRV